MPAKGFLSLEKKQHLQEILKHSQRADAHRLFESVAELKSLLDRLLNDGELIIKWERKIKNKGNAICAI